jgi:4'-phosphopantetheinyl transferase EntD
VLEEILPAAVAVASTRRNSSGVELFPEEASVIANSVEKRRLEFATARACAREALAHLGLPPVAVLPGPKGEPRWPDGIVGSITHCDGYCACALARDGDLLSIGVDAEPDQALPTGLLGDIALPREREWIRAMAASRPGVSWDRLLFSIKEAIYKAWFPLTGRWLGFEDATVSIDVERERFVARLLVPAPVVRGRDLSGFEGRWLAREGLLLAAIAMPAPPPRA